MLLFLPSETVPSSFSCTALKSCEHWFCNECWKSYLSAEINQGKTNFKCPSSDCDTSVDDITIIGTPTRKISAVFNNEAREICGDQYLLEVVPRRQM